MKTETAWVYENMVECGTFTVGHYDPEGKWHPESDWSTRNEAAARVNYLNGGTGKEQEIN